MTLNPIADSRDVRFVLFEMLKSELLREKFEKYADFDRDIYEDILNLAEKIAVAKTYPANAEGDKAGCIYNPYDKSVLRQILLLLLIILMLGVCFCG